MASLALISAVFIVWFTQVASDKILKFYNVDYVYNEKYISNMTCDLKVRGRDVVQTNGFFVLKNYVKNAKIQAQLFKVEERLKPFLLNVTFNICNVSKLKGVDNLLVTIALKILGEYSNLVKCGHEVSKADADDILKILRTCVDFSQLNISGEIWRFNMTTLNYS